MDANVKTLLRSALGTLAGVCSVLSVAACDSFLVPTCSFYPAYDGCPDAGSGGPLGQAGGGGDLMMREDLPKNPEPTFGWAAKVPLQINIIKYAGMAQDKAITWNNDTNPNYLKSWTLKLDVVNNYSDEVVGQFCNDCANELKSVDNKFNDQQIYIAGGNYWKLKYRDEYNLVHIVANAVGVPGIKLSSLQRPRAFAHPTKNSLVVGVDEAPGLVGPGVAVMQNQALVLSIPNAQGSPTAFVLGDLDAIDRNNGIDEVIVFAGSAPLLLARPTLDPTARYDPVLLDALKKAISDASIGDSSVDAAFITDLNNDGRTDFVYIRNRTVFVATYLGKYKFQNWSASIPLSETMGETIKSLSAVDITKDGLPELVVETDAAVHFYVNQPK